MVFFDSDVGEIKDYLGIEHDDDDPILAELVVSAEARLQQYLIRQLHAVEVTEVFDGGHRSLILTHYPVKTTPAIIVTDLVTAEVIDAAFYRLKAANGLLIACSASGFPSWWEQGIQRWSAKYTGGVDADATWATTIEPDLRHSLKDLVKSWYDGRSPLDRTISTAQVPDAIRSTWDAYR